MRLDRDLLDDLLAEPPEWLLRRVRQSAVALFALGVFAFLIVGANRPANPYLLPPGGKVTDKSLSGFGAGYLEIAAGAGLHSSARPQCMLLATTTAQQERGLMNQTSLHGFTGMVFEWTHPTRAAFYMKDTLIPLSIAWFAPDGSYLSSTNMNPCPATALVCPTFTAASPYVLAVEVPEGHLAGLGIGPGSSVQLGGPCAQ